MTREEASALLHRAQWVLHDMGLQADEGVAEMWATRLYHPLSREDALRAADSVLPPGRRGRVRLVLYPPASARATAFVAAVLRAYGRSAPAEGEP